MALERECRHLLAAKYWQEEDRRAERSCQRSLASVPHGIGSCGRYARYVGAGLLNNSTKRRIRGKKLEAYALYFLPFLLVALRSNSKEREGSMPETVFLSCVAKQQRSQRFSRCENLPKATFAMSQKRKEGFDALRVLLELRCEAEKIRLDASEDFI